MSSNPRRPLSPGDHVALGDEHPDCVVLQVDDDGFDWEDGEGAGGWEPYEHQDGQSCWKVTARTLPTEWTHVERIAVATRLLGIIQLDVPAGRYGEVGRPNIMSVLHVLHEDRDVLNDPGTRRSLERVLALEGENLVRGALPGTGQA